MFAMHNYHVSIMNLPTYSPEADRDAKIARSLLRYHR